ncbi:hypothetical protein JCGZ_25212 [Jatropha curcas]|uniref:Uncharacterized protein n=1 Tax=Jatropha curcas TaxID=180498 RepID=A0A067L3H9_JATCU|nr:hypothetical protein JCGZ_25212 [Jatropha curcas]
MRWRCKWVAGIVLEQRQPNCGHMQGGTDLLEEEEDRWWCDRGSIWVAGVATEPVQVSALHRELRSPETEKGGRDGDATCPRITSGATGFPENETRGRGDGGAMKIRPGLVESQFVVAFSHQ